MGNFDERDKREAQSVIIEDKRHGRDWRDDDAIDPETEASPDVAAAEQAPEIQPVELQATDVAVPEPVTEQVEAAADGAELDAAQQAEMAYLMQLFHLGQAGYLRSQLGVLLNFAMINLGRMPNPATGIVTADLDQAKIAIDVFEFVLVKVQAQLEARERMELTQLLSDLKYTFMQALGAGPGNGVTGAG